MTVKELYDWAVENGCDNGEILLRDSETEDCLGHIIKQDIDCVDGGWTGKYTVVHV